MAETTYSWTNTDKRDLSEALAALIVANPSLLNLVKINNGIIAEHTKHEWLDQALSPTSTLLDDGTGISDSDTAIVVDSTTGFLAGDIILFEDNTLFDLAKISVVDSPTQLTVTRGYGGSTAAAHSDNCKITLHSRPKLESSDPSATDSSEPDVYYNYTQIFRRDVKVSKTAQAMKYYSTKDLLADGAEQKLKEIMWELNHALIAGGRYEPGSAATARTAGGLLYFLSTEAPAGNLVDASGVALTTALVNNIIENIVKLGGSVNTLVMGTWQARRVAALNSVTSNVLINVDQMATSAGIPAPSKFFGDLPGIISNIVIDTNMPSDKVVITDINKIKVIPMTDRTVGMSNSDVPGGDYFQRTILGEYTVEIHNPAQSHGMLYNLATS